MSTEVVPAPPVSHDQPVATDQTGSSIPDPDSVKHNSVIELDRSEVNCEECVGIYWNIEGLEPSEQDFIGMFKSSEGAPIDIDSLIDHRLRGYNSAHSGSLTWMIERDKFNRHGKTEVCFCYYDHLNVLRARSSTLTVINSSAELAVEPANMQLIEVASGPDSDKTVVTKQQSGEIPVINKSPRRQTSDPHGLSIELNRIRQTLYSSGLRPQRPTMSKLFRRHTTLYTAQRSHDLTTSMVVRPLVPHPQPPSEEVSVLTESLPPNWEVRTSEAGTLMYYDHEHKVVKLEKPDETTGHNSPRIEDFLRRSNLNLMQRQLSNSNFQHSTNQKTSWTRSNTVTGALCPQHHTPQDGPTVKVVQPDKPVSETTAQHEVTNHVEKSIDSTPTIQTEPEVGSDRIEQKDDEQSHTNGVPAETNGLMEGDKIEDPPIVADRDQQLLPGERARKEGVHQDGIVAMERLLSRQDSIDEDLRQSPGFMFITRPDLYKFAKEVNNDVFFKNLAVLELIQTIRSDHSLYAKYQHSSKLVRVINTFARTECEIPDGWEKKVDPKTGKHVYIDHNSRQTSYIDPRLPFPGNDLNLTSATTQTGLVSRTRPFVTETVSGLLSRPRLPSSFSHPGNEQTREARSASFSTPTSNHGALPIPGVQIMHPPAPPPSLLTPPPPAPIVPSVEGTRTPSQENNYSDRVVMFLRQPNVFDLLRSRYDSSLSLNLISAIHEIQSEGRDALEVLQNEMDSLYLELTIILSLFEEEIAHFIFPVSRTASLSSSHTPPSQPLPSPLSEPLPQQPDTNNEPPTLNMEDMTFAGLPVATIVEFFNQPNIYHHVLSRFNAVSSEHRDYVQWFENGPDPDDVNVRLTSTTDESFRQFVSDLSSRMLEEPPPATAATNDETDDTSHDIVNHTFGGMTMEEILQFFIAAQESGSVLNVHVMLADVGTLSADELEQRLSENDELREFVMQLRPEIQAHGDRPATSPFPSVEQIRNYFVQSEIYAIVIQHIGVISIDDRAAIERIRTTELERLDERLLWDIAMRRFIMRFTDAIYEYDEPVVRPITPPPLTSPFDPPPPPPLSTLKKSAQKRQFIDKLGQLQRTLTHNGYADPSYHADNVTINRDHLLRDAYGFIMGTSAKSLRKRPCNIKWNREEGLDYGGPQREFFFKLSRQLFNPYYGLFEYSAHGSYTVQISAQSAIIGDALYWFRFAGRMIGYAIIQGHLLDVFFARHVYKDLLGRSYSISDIETLDISFHNSLNYVLNNDPEPLELMFTVLEETFGDASEYELTPGGAHIPVTEENKMEYLDLMVQWRLSRGVKQQTESFIKGFKEMIPRGYLENFDPQELEWVIAGTPEINMDDWKNNTVYWGGYYKDHKVIKWFWEVVESYTTEQKLRLLQFVTGTSSIPFEGFKALRGSNSLQKFTIDTLTGSNAMFSLPIAHTCFNRLDMPEYWSKETLYEKLTLAVEECGTFENA